MEMRFGGRYDTGGGLHDSSMAVKGENREKAEVDKLSHGRKKPGDYMIRGNLAQKRKREFTQKSKRTSPGGAKSSPGLAGKKKTLEKILERES